jgi:hypothetical protein
MIPDQNDLPVNGLRRKYLQKYGNEFPVYDIDYFARVVYVESSIEMAREV